MPTTPSQAKASCWRSVWSSSLSGDGTCIQGAVFEAVPGRMPFDYESAGEQSLKGISEPVRAYAVSVRAGESIPEPEAEADAGGCEHGSPTRVGP